MYIQADIQDVIDQVIGRGGKTAADTEEKKSPELKKANKGVRFTLRLPSHLINKIDEVRKLRAGIISRNQWILEAISKATATKTE